ncbi:MAG TPA: hypothetical protein ENO19_09000, partial [Halothiobacillaceae bacterium]|nr:hypothetical protein [Halothiobacillaceae bacterium]
MAPEPSVRSAHAIAWHAGLERVVMYGGMTRGGPDADVLWAYDGKHWEPHRDSPNPGRRAHFAFAYDAARDRLLVHGGFRAEGRVITDRFADTWAWDQDGWHLLDSDGFGPRDHHAMACDTERREVVLFGGGDSTGVMPPGTWAWNGESW